jgi:hypothetical protein
MKEVFLLAMFVMLPVAQAQSPVFPAACGASDVKFDVKLDKSQHTLAQPVTGKALVYFFEDDNGPTFGEEPAYTTRIGLDGAWVGADKNKSYFSVTVEPGEHHLCANFRRRRSFVPLRSPTELAHFRAEVGKTYYFRTRRLADQSFVQLLLEPVDSDEGEYLISTYPLSVSQPRK